MNQRSTLRTFLVLVSIVFISSLSHSFFTPLENKFYDQSLAVEHDSYYMGQRLHPALRLLHYSEADAESQSPWSSKKSHELANFLKQQGARAGLYHPSGLASLYPDPPVKDRVRLLSLGREAGTEPLGAELDSDGICRKAKLAFGDVGQTQPSPLLQVYAQALGVEASEIVFGPSWIKVGERIIATDPQYRIDIRFRRSEEAHRVDGTDYLAPRSLSSFWEGREQRKEDYRDKIFLVGTGLKQAPGMIATPLGQLQDFKVSACVLETLMTQWSVTRPQGWTAFALLCILVLVSYQLFSHLPVPAIALAWVAIQLVYLQLAQSAFHLGFYLPHIPFLLATTLVALQMSLEKFRQARVALQRFGGLGALEAAHRGDAAVFDEVREKTATIVFTNVLSYLKEMERHGSPDQFFERRQAYAQLLSDVFRKHGGVILDYQGDFQMVGFNVELRTDDPEHAVHAVKACREFLERLPEVTRLWWEADEHEIGSGHCGICTGPVACGHVGSQRQDGGRIAQAAIGDTSNVAARLLGAAMKSNEPILIAKTTVDAAAGKLQAEELEPIPLKGKALPVEVAKPIFEESSHS